MISRKLMALPVGLAVAALAACSGTSTISGEELAESAEDALEEEIGERPDIDCGEDDIEPEEGMEVTCVLSDPASGTEYDTTITFTSADGDDWDFDIQVAETAN